MRQFTTQEQVVGNRLQGLILGRLEQHYRSGVGLEPERSCLNEGVADSLLRILPKHAIGQMSAFLKRNPWIFQKIKARFSSQHLFRQPVVLLVYFLVDTMPAQTREHWPLPERELARIFSDLGVAF